MSIGHIFRYNSVSMRKFMEHCGQDISFVERACIFKTKEENEFLSKPIILIAIDILTESHRQVLESKSLVYTNLLSYNIISLNDIVLLDVKFCLFTTACMQ